MTRRRTVKIVLTAVCVSVTVVFLYSLSQARRFRIQLDDGTTVSLAAVTFGKHHVLKRRGTKWWQILLPPIESARLDTDSDELVLWLDHQMLSNSSSNRPGAASGAGHRSWWDWLEIRDSTGAIIRRSSPLNSLLASNLPVQVPMVWGYDGELVALPVFPRRSPTLTITFHRVGESVPTAEFSVPNPVYNTYPRWKPDVPANRQAPNGVLLDLQTSDTFSASTGTSNVVASNGTITSATSVANPAEKGRPGDVHHSSISITVNEDGRPISDWDVLHVNDVDATGNIGYRDGDPGQSALMTDGQSIGFDSATVSNEVQHLHVEYCQNEKCRVQQSQLWTLPAVSLPPHGNVVKLQNIGQPKGANVREVIIGAPGKTSWGSNSWEKMISSSYFVRVVYGQSTPSNHFLLRRDVENGGSTIGTFQTNDIVSWDKPFEEADLAGTGASVVLGFTLHSNSNNGPVTAGANVLGSGSDGTNSWSYAAASGSTGSDICRTFFFAVRPRSGQLHLKFAVFPSRFADFFVDVNRQEYRMKH